MFYPMGSVWAHTRPSLICTHESSCHVSQLQVAALCILDSSLVQVYLLILFLLSERSLVLWIVPCIPWCFVTKIKSTRPHLPLALRTSLLKYGSKSNSSRITEVLYFHTRKLSTSPSLSSSWCNRSLWNENSKRLDLTDLRCPSWFQSWLI